MGYIPKRVKKTIEDTVLGQTINIVAAFKVRQNIYIQKNQAKRNIHNKMLSLQSHRSEAELV